MSGEETVLCLAQDIVQSGASMIEMVDFSEQTGACALFSAQLRCHSF